jgi:hypothetical protein
MGFQRRKEISDTATFGRDKGFGAWIFHSEPIRVDLVTIELRND